MPLSTATVDFDLSDYLGTDFDPKGTKVWVTTNIENETVIDKGANKIRLGSGSVALNADGTGSVTVWVPGVDSNPASWQTYIHVEYFDPHGSNYRRATSTRTFGPFTITESKDLADLVAEQEIPAEYLASVTSSLGGYVSSAQVAATTAAASATSAAASADAATTITGLTGEDDAVALLINDDTSDVKGALSATYGRKYQAGIEVSEDFSAYPNGAAPAATARTGQAAQNYGTADVEGRQPWISGGKMTYKDQSTGILGSYRQYPLEGNGSKTVLMEAGFTFTPWSSGGGLACLALMDRDFVAYHRANNAVPRSAFHLTISPEAWGLSTFPTAGGAPVNRGGGLWKGGNLVADDTTVHRVSVILDGTNGVAYIFLPDGTFATITHADLKIPSLFFYAEPYRDAAAGRTVAKFTDVQADSRRTDLLPLMKAAVQPRVSATHSFPGSAVNMTLSTTASAVAGTATTFMVPPSGTVLVELEGLIDVTTDGAVHFGLFNTANALVAVRTVATKVSHSGRATAALTYTPSGGPGAKETVTMVAYRDAAAVATLILGNSGSVYGSANVKVSPI